MDALIIFLAIFTPTFVLNLLSAGRDQMLFETHPKSSRWLIVAAMLAALGVLLVLGLSWPWALALVLPGPMGSALGDWVGSGNWLVLRHRIAAVFQRH